MIAATGGKAFWYATRGTGVVSLILLTASVVLGIVTSIRLEARGWPRYVIELVHKNVSLLVVVFLGLHIVTTVQDGYVPIHYLDALIPFRSPYRTFWLGLGTVAFDLLVALVVTSLLRVRLGYRSWRFVHWFAYVCWPFAFVHALGTGSDARYGWSVVLDLAMLAAVVASAASARRGRSRSCAAVRLGRDRSCSACRRDDRGVGARRTPPARLGSYDGAPHDGADRRAVRHGEHEHQSRYVARGRVGARRGEGLSWRGACGSARWRDRG